MSVKKVADAFHRSPYKGAAFVIHVALAHAADGKGEVWVRLDDLADMARCAPSTVTEIVKQMMADNTVRKLDKDEENRRTLFALIDRPDLPVVWGKPKAVTLNDDGFDEFWAQYPRRNGKRGWPAKAKERWCKLSKKDRALAMRAVGNYAAAAKGGWKPKDAERFLLMDYWREWIDEGSSPDVPTRPSNVPARAEYDSTSGKWVW